MNAKILTEKRKKLKLTQDELAEKIGVSRKTINNYENGGSIPESKIVLLEMVLNEPKKFSIQEPKDVSNKDYLPASTDVSIPYYNVDFAGGWTTEELFATQNPLFIITNPVFERSDFACNLHGDSVSEKIPSGAVIGLKKIEDWQIYFPTDNFYGIITKNDLRTVKLVYRSKKDKNLLILKSCPRGKESIEENIPIDFVASFFQVIAWEKFERLVI